MSPVNLIPIVVLFCLVGGVIYLLLRITKMDVPKDRFASIDGLRGVLAFSVFLHHSVVWFYFLKTSGWAFPPSNVYNHFGPSSVAMFFMITAFLFYSKLLDAKDKGIDWLKLYASRIFRIMPLYFFAVLVLFLLVGLVSHFTFHESLFQVVLEFFQWLFFIDADVNGIPGTRLIVAGVVWSLAYEWLFYCSLALVGKMFFRIKTPVKVLIVTGLLFIAFLVIIQSFYPYGIVRRMCPFA